MFKFTKIAAACSVAALAVAGTPAIAAPYTAPTVDGTATVRLYDAIELAKVTNIDFGTIIRDASFTGTGTVTMAADSTTDCLAQANISCTGATSAGHFTIKGDTGSDMSVSLTSADYTAATNVLQLKNGTNTVDLTLDFSGMTQDQAITGYDPVTNAPIYGANLNSFSVTGTGAATNIFLFGALSFGDSTAAPNGVYQSTFTLTADYK